MRLLLLGSFLLLAPSVAAQQLVYQPTNPAFGGFSSNYSWLLSSATTQNDFTETSASSFRRSPLDDFQNSLQRQILSQLSRELILSRFGDLDLSQAGTFNFGDFTVEITPGLDGVSIRIFNLLTGDETTVSIPNGGTLGGNFP